ncbi:gamma carbonic anhydrase family protein [Roseococcus sp. DSY-14]|uniref:gamma carbonic anhydrase family protein n=1 Tax=Roseococcus sp. DSY-14 TaxID=3369650 RepID=UPI00387A988C
MSLLPFEGRRPVLHPTAWVAPNAVVVGDVELGEGASVWYGCVLRGDTNFIRVGARSNLQDGTIVHVNRMKEAALIGADVTVGHAAIIHACTLEDGAFIGMGATVLDGAVVGQGAMLGAGALLPPGKRVPPGELWVGSPARFLRVLSAPEREGLAATTAHYVELAMRHRTSLA